MLLLNESLKTKYLLKYLKILSITVQVCMCAATKTEKKKNARIPLIGTRISWYGMTDKKKKEYKPNTNGTVYYDIVTLSLRRYHSISRTFESVLRTWVRFIAKIYNTAFDRFTRRSP
jgi:hypothetical protein